MSRNEALDFVQPESRSALPKPHENIRFDRLSSDAVATLMRDRVVVLKDFFPLYEAESARRYARNLINAQAPLRAARIALHKALPDTTTLPGVLKRRPLIIPLSKPNLFPLRVQTANFAVQDANNQLWLDQAVREEYGDTPRHLTHAVVNRTAKNEWFCEHQDSVGIRGFGYALQTARTLWHVKPSQTIPGTEDFTFKTDPGDLVILRERAGELEPEATIPMGSGFIEQVEDGSIVHTGLNLSGKTRYTINLFDIEKAEV